MTARFSIFSLNIVLQNNLSSRFDLAVKEGMFKSDPLAAKMSQFHSIQGGSVLVDPSKSIPKLQIAMLVVGTRGDVQPFLAVAKKLQACI